MPLLDRRWLAACGAAVSMTWASLLFAGSGEISFTPTGFKVSIMKVALASAGDGGQPMGEQVLYTCSGATESDCLVDVTNQVELDAIAARAASVGVAAGTYDTVTLDFCRPGQGGDTPAPGFVRGSFTVPSEGTTYVTDDDAGVTGLRAVADAADEGASFVAIGNWRCGQKSIVLPVPLVVKKDTTTPLSIVVDAKFIANSTPHVSPGMGGCRGESNGQSRGLCVNYPSIFPLVGADDSELDRFLLAHHSTDPAAIDDTKANGYVVVARSGDGGTPLIAYTRPYFSETSAGISQRTVQDSLFGGPAYLGDTIVSSFRVAGDGTVSFVTGGSMDTNSAIFPAFTLADHHGVVDTHDAGAWQYHAMPIH